MNITPTRTSFPNLSVGLALFFLLGSFGLQAQFSGIRPMERSVVTGKDAEGLAKQVCTSDAGTIAGFYDINLTSTSFGGATTANFAARPDTIFLCFGDSFMLDYEEGSEDLSGDPVPETRAGIGYSFYGCTPTVTGISKDDVDADPCVIDIGAGPFDGTIAVAAPDGYFDSSPNYDLEFANDDLTDFAVFGGPITFSVAPITLDSLDRSAGGTPIARVESTPLTPECINVRVDQSFSVAILEPITIQNPTQNSGSCSGSFDLFGGVSQLRGTSEYNITITNTATGTAATVTSSPSGHGGTVAYSVPAPGDYEITIEDGIGCGMSQTVTHTGVCPPPTTTALMVGTVSIQAVSCPGEDDGMLTAT
ncbi:MAG: hypothetical protein WA952_05245, partial [Lewinella sp.]